jgi:tRNA(Arg) A34 adenosine deaminase TadA
MCAAAMARLRVGRVVYGCSNSKFGGCGSVLQEYPPRAPLPTSGKAEVLVCGTAATQVHSMLDPPATSFAAALERAPASFGTLRSGVLASEAIELLRRFFAIGNARSTSVAGLWSL